MSSFNSQKTCILKYKPWMQLSAGLHDIGDAKIAETPAVLCHFKYHASFHKKVMDEIGRNQHFDDSAECRAYAEALGGGFNCFYSKEGSVRWDRAEIIKRTLSGDSSCIRPDAPTAPCRRCGGGHRPAPRYRSRTAASPPKA
ncbi:hypothetical protein [Paracoccus sp. PAR01]|uniref:hypothetical protein n=1 Tax=Paracoccus sp. PAR01 TaxID=2769282 RepID=UPI001784B7B7|nr:hypothetical protein [Paracoccus sp. PAR01]MBD9529378.1 hypothetical protein [Paracoccus sp. PAR01]